MREVLFRGKRVDTGEWVRSETLVQTKVAGCPLDEVYLGAGNLCRFHEDESGNVEAIEDMGVPILHKIDPATLGQHTGLTDKNGEKIFEGDIVDLLSEVEETGIIKWDEDSSRFAIWADGFIADFDNYCSTDLEIIGNIYDNP